MTENVIEQIISRLRGYEYDGYVPPEDGSARKHAEEAVDEVADLLEAATRPEQFMPPLREWPEDATHCCVDFYGRVQFSKEWRDGPFRKSMQVGPYDRMVRLPYGIDYRTCAGSREQMEKWEAENG